MKLAKNIEIERLRGIAILLTMYTHFWPFTRVMPEVIGQGPSGVDLFFVISGYVIYLSLLRKLPQDVESDSALQAIDRARAGLKNFFAKRFFRIVPAAVLWIVIPFFFYTVVWVDAKHENAGRMISETISILSLQNNYYQAYGGSNILGPYWSLMVEEHFYLLLPFLLLLCRTESRRLLAVVLGIVMVAAVIRPLGSAMIPLSDPLRTEQLTYLSHYRFDALLAGVLLGLMRVRGWGESAKDWRPAVAIGAVLILAFLLWTTPAIYPMPVYLNTGRISIWLISAALVFFASLEKNWVFPGRIIGPTLAYLGSRSYGLYLCHIFSRTTYLNLESFLSQFLSAEGYVGPFIAFVLYLGFAVLLAEATYRLVEGPFIRYSNR